MNKPEPIFTTRQTVTLRLPLAKNTRILHPEQVILQIDEHYQDLGAFCYALRSDNKRPRQPREVVLDSFLKQRPNQVLQLIKMLSGLITDGGKRLATVVSYSDTLKMFIDYADGRGLHDCLAGGDATRKAYQAWAEDTHERYRLQEFSGSAHNARIKNVCTLLEALTGLHELDRGIRKIMEPPKSIGGTEPLAPHDFAHGLALNQALFEGLCDLVLERRPFPYKLALPTSLGWEEHHLWLFPANLWCLPPHRGGDEREKLIHSYWNYDYAAGRLATVEDIWHRYASCGRGPSTQRGKAKKLIARAKSRLRSANINERDPKRLMLGMIAHNAFLFLFVCYTGANESVAREIETGGEIDESTLNQHFRSIKFRAQGKLVTLCAPAAFMPSLRRFMELRRYLLDDKHFPYLFLTLGQQYKARPKKIARSVISNMYRQLLGIDPRLPRMAPRKLRASVADWYQRHHGALVSSKVLQNSEETAQKRYDAGSATDHREELTLFLTAVSETAKRQRVIPIQAVDTNATPLDEGGRCNSFGHPEALTDQIPIKPNCRDSQGCLFCKHRVLVACEEDARKVASAAFVMEQVILGPQHEEALRPLIAKCDEDLENIASFGSCRAMVERVRKDVFENSNLTPFFADKYQLFLELGVIA